MSAFLNRLLAERFINQPNREKTYEIYKQALGTPSTGVGSFTGTDVTYDEAGNPIPENVRYSYGPHGGTGLLADIYNPTNQARFANEMMRAPHGESISNAMMNQIQTGGQVLDKMDYENFRQDSIVEQARAMVMGAPMKSPQPSSLRGRSPVVPNLAASTGFSRAPNTGVPSEGAPLIGDSRAPTGAMSREEEYRNRRAVLESIALQPEMTAAMKPIIESLDIQYGMGPGAPKEAQIYNLAKADPDFNKWYMDQKRAGAVNMGESVVTPEQSGKLRNSRNEPAPIGMTYSEAWAQGFRPSDAAERKIESQFMSGTGVANSIEDKLFGPGGLLMDNGKEISSDWWDRLAASPGAIWNYYTQDDPRVGEYTDFVMGTLSPFVKSLGEVGALAEGDVERALGLFPKVYPIPDTPDMSRRKISNMKTLIEKGDNIKALQRINNIKVGESREGMTYIGGDPRAEGNWIPDEQYDPYKKYTFKEYGG